MILQSLLLTAAAAGLLGAEGRADTRIQSEERSASEVARSALRGTSFDFAALQAGLSELGADAPAEVWSILLAGELPARDEDPAVDLTRAQELLLVQALTLGLRPQMLAFLASRLGVLRAEAERTFDLRMLGEVGGAGELELALRLAPEARTAPTVEPAVLAELETTLRRLLRREPDGVLRLPTLLSTCHPALRTVLVRAVSRSGADGSRTALARALGRAREVDPILLVELLRQRTPEAQRPDDLVTQLVRPYLLESDPALVTLAVQLAGGFDDRGAIPSLVALLRAGDANVRAAAGRVLEGLTGITWGCHAQAWEGWLLEELAWWESEAAACASAIATAPSAEANAAIFDLARHRLHPERAVQMLTRGLARREADVLGYACRGLAGLRPTDASSAVGALDALCELLADPRSAVRAQAHDALRKITGEDLPEDLAAWRAALASRPRTP